MCVVLPAPARAGLTHGLSRMMGNYQVRFLGEGAAAMSFPYPASQHIAGCATDARYSSGAACFVLGQHGRWPRR